ncbi:hypothetical protein K469DRAFT_698210 [Zopfia rhizophila CBS 207.26]|uniref:Uncharacterized protein n=1 Tax=Zopfia rhizophila CBS 207.26 TaxID=1314779 RepID=A0A6A6DB41_9PEZI|nr:hypothetical protein K469DRAFT_698210 [Zopfia rhizophila CBS 207.26]
MCAMYRARSADGILSADVTCSETCAFCGCHISRVRKYVTHYDACKAKKNQEGNGYLSTERQSIAIQRRKRLCRMAAQELDLKMSAIAEMEIEEVPRGQRSSESLTRKRTLEMTDTDSEELRQSRKRRITTGDGADSSVPVPSESSHQALSELKTATQLDFSMNGSLGPMVPTATAPLTSHCNLNKSSVLSGTDDQFSTENTEFLPYSISEGAFVSQYGAAHTRAPLLFSHTMDGSSTYSTGYQYEGTSHARAPLLSSHTMDGSSSYSVGQNARAHVRAPLLSSHTMDGYQAAYGALAQARTPMVEYHAVDRCQSNTQVASDGIATLYGTSQPILLCQNTDGYT